MTNPVNLSKCSCTRIYSTFKSPSQNHAQILFGKFNGRRPWNNQGLCSDAAALWQCSSAGKVCHNTNDNTNGCCCDSRKLLPADDYQCMMDNNCTLRCIKPKIIDGKHIFPITCDIGTYCPLSSHGTPQVCAETLHPVAKSKKHGRCCGDRDDVPEEQTAKGCCNHGIGMDCMDPDRRACCLGVTNSVEYNPDEIDWCQRNCSQPAA